MSKNINVNPDHYKVAGRERQGEDVIHRAERKSLSDAKARHAKTDRRKPAKDTSRGK